MAQHNPLILANQTIICVICGGVCKPTINRAWHFRGADEPDWMHPTLIKCQPGFLTWTPDRRERRSRQLHPDAVVSYEVISFPGGPKNLTVKTDGRESYMSINCSEDEMAIPVHKACLRLAEFFCRHQVRFYSDYHDYGGGHPSSLLHFYEIWCQRARMTCHKGLITKPIRDPFGYSGAPVYASLEDYRWAQYRDSSLWKFQANPLNISPKYVTSWVVNRNIKLMTKTDSRYTERVGFELLRRIKALPAELEQLILDHLLPLEDIDDLNDLTPTRIVDNYWWRKALFDGKLIPWLFDLNGNLSPPGFGPPFLDRDEHYTFVGEADTGLEDVEEEGKTAGFFELDWESLCRQLAYKHVFDASKGGILANPPHALWNRHRIWNLLDKARRGHVVHYDSATKTQRL